MKDRAAVMFIAAVVMAAVITAAVLLLDGDEDGAKLTLIAPEMTKVLAVPKGGASVGDLLEEADIEDSKTTYLYLEDGGIVRVNLGSELTVSEGSISYDGGTVRGLAASNGPDEPQTLMDVNRMVLSSLNLSREPSTGPTIVVKRAVVLEFDGLGYQAMTDPASGLFTRNLSMLGNLTPVLTAYPPITNVGTAMAVTGQPPSQNGVLARSDHMLRKPTFLESAMREGANATWLDGELRFLDADMVNVVDSDRSGDSDEEVRSALLERIASDDDVIMAHYHAYDDSTHDHGPLAPESLSVLGELDRALGEVIGAITDSGVPTLLLVFSDHGSHPTEEGGAHGDFDDRDMFAIMAWRVIGEGRVFDPPALSISVDGAIVSELSLEGLSNMPFHEDIYDLGSSKGTLTNTYRGVPLIHLLNLTGGTGPYSRIGILASDGYGSSIDPSWAGDPGTIIAYSKDGGPLGDEGPLRLILPQDLAGEYNSQYCVKHMVRIEVVT